MSAAGAAGLLLIGRMPESSSAWGLWWAAALAANLAAQFALAAGVGAGVAFVCRRWAAGLVALASLLVLVVGVLGVPRAAVDPDADGPRVRVLVYNALSSSASADEQAAMMLESNADLIALNEPSPGLLAMLRSDSPLREAYPHFRLPDRAGPGFRVVLSRHPLLRGVDGFGPAWPELREVFGRHGQRVVRVSTPSGPFVFVLAQFRSPRSVDRWRNGNRQAVDTAAGLRMLRGMVELPTIVAGDFNASPTGWRCVLLRSSAGLLETKPALRASGTYPAGLPWPAQSAIDGAMVSPGVRVVSWSVVGPAGSDHLGVLVDLALPGAALPD